jgi:DNA repair photolyase
MMRQNAMQLTTVQVLSVLTRASGYLQTVCSHSLQPYRGCALGNALCGVGCYVRHNRWITRGREWGSFVEARQNAAEVYRGSYAREKAWARRSPAGRFSVFLSSSTEPFQPAEFKFGITRSVLEAMLHEPPDELILQTHTHRVAAYLPLHVELSKRTRLRVHLSVESDRDRLPGLPPAASPVGKRLAAAAALRSAGVRVVITVSPLLPIESPFAFFRRLSEVADAVVLDHWIQGDGSPGGSGARTFATRLPQAVRDLDPHYTTLAYRDEMVAIARHFFPASTGVGIDGFAGRFLST